MSDPARLLDTSIRHGIQSILLQLDAKAAIEQAPPSGGYIVVTPGQSLPQVLESLAGGEVVYVQPEVLTVGDLTIRKPVRLVGAAITGRVDVQAPDVSLLGCSITGPDENGALLSTADRLFVQGCRLQGSSKGQHRGVWVRSSNVTICDTSVVSIWKVGQEAQAIAGWDGVAHLRVERCWLEAAGENFMLGGTDSSSEASMPHDVTLRHCVMMKPLQWRNVGVVVKNLFEIKCVKQFLMEHCYLDHVWVEGQTGFAMVINVRNQEGGAPWSTIEDVTIRNCNVWNMAGGVQLLGTDYTYPSGLMKRVTIENNVFGNISPNYGDNQRVLQLSHGGEDLVFRNNQFSGTNINSFLTFEGQPLQRFVFEGNTCPEGSYGIKADDTSLGTPTLEKYAPGCTWTNNTVVRSVASNTIPYPPGTTVVAG